MTKTKAIIFRCTDQQARFLEREAARLGISVSEYLRRRLFEEPDSEARFRAVIREEFQSALRKGSNG